MSCDNSLIFPTFRLLAPLRTQTTMPRRYLVITPIGSHDSAHKQWIDPARNFDLFLVNYGDTAGLFRDDADRYFEMPGFKLQTLPHSNGSKSVRTGNIS